MARFVRRVSRSAPLANARGIRELRGCDSANRSVPSPAKGGPCPLSQSRQGRKSVAHRGSGGRLVLRSYEAPKGRHSGPFLFSKSPSRDFQRQGRPETIPNGNSRISNGVCCAGSTGRRIKHIRSFGRFSSGTRSIRAEVRVRLRLVSPLRGSLASHFGFPPLARRATLLRP